jgi:hypothetical protein
LARGVGVAFASEGVAGGATFVRARDSIRLVAGFASEAVGNGRSRRASVGKTAGGVLTAEACVEALALVLTVALGLVGSRGNVLDVSSDKKRDLRRR